MSGAHTSEKRWYRNQNPNGNVGVAERIQKAAQGAIAGLEIAESMFGEMQEMYAYVGSTMQDLADQLFLEKWSVRSSPGVTAVLTVDVVVGAVDSVAITQAGTGYTDGVGYTINLLGTAGGGDGAGVLSYDVVNGSVANATVATPGTTYDNGLGQTVGETPAAGAVPDTGANATELSMTQDAFDAVTAMHELYLCLTNNVVAQEDRLAQLRRMS